MKLDKQQKQTLSKIAKKYNLALILLFGSQAKGLARKDSDVDIAIKTNNKIDLDQELEIIYQLSKIFGQKIDLTIINRADPLLLAQISRAAILLAGSEKDFFNFKLYAFHRYNDYKPFLQLEDKIVRREVKIINQKND
jgi:predicted nucleotidyltransferase